MHLLLSVLCWFLRIRGTRKIVIDGALYLERFVLWGRIKDDPGPWGINVWIHRIHLPDGDRDMHNHPWWWSFGVVLSGGYCETRARTAEWRFAPGQPPCTRRLNPGNVTVLGYDSYHVIETVRPKTWTLFITGRTTNRGWGFLVADGNHKKHIDSSWYKGGK